jgi:hypothetical protein
VLFAVWGAVGGSLGSRIVCGEMVGKWPTNYTVCFDRVS